MKDIKRERTIKRISGTPNFFVEEQVELELSWNEIIQSYQEWQKRKETLEQQLSEEYLEARKKELSDLNKNLEQLHEIYKEAREIHKELLEEHKKKLEKENEETTKTK